MARAIAKTLKNDTDHLRKTESKAVLESWAEDANSDQAEPIGGPVEIPYDSRMTAYFEFNAHPDLKRKIQAVARERRTKEAPLCRELLILGLEAAGYKL